MSAQSTYLVLQFLCVGLAFAASLAVYLSSPSDMIPIHFDGNLRPDRYAGRAALFALPFFTLAIGCLQLILKRFGRSGIGETKTNILYAAMLAASLISLAIQGLVLWTVLWGPIRLPTITRVESVVGTILGIGMCGSASRITTLRPRSRFGLGTPWTFASVAIWRKTHRHIARLVLVLGVALIAVALVIPAYVPTVVLTGAGIIALWSTLYARRLAMRYSEESQETDFSK